MKSELRRDPISGRTVIIAKERSERPHDFGRPEPVRVPHACPFCLGHEGDTPPALAVYRPAGETLENSGWRVRVIPNKYAALSLDGPSPHADGAATLDRSAPLSLPGLLQTGYGAHEVIVESPRHVTCFRSLDEVELRLTLAAYRDRLRLHADNVSLRYAQVFKNTGAAGGASVEHVHSQLIATPFVPGDVRNELASCRHYYEQKCRCVFCDLVELELSQSVRVVAQTDTLVAFCPYAARFPYETWVLPRQHGAHYGEISERQLVELGPLLQSLVGAATSTSGQDAYNFLLHTAPFDTSPSDHYHWHIEIFPRMLEVAGFEWGTGCFINPVPPEDAAEQLRGMAQSFQSGKTS